MPPLSELAQRALLSGSAASIVSTAVLIARGKRELDAPAAPMNGPSQWVWGLHAPYVDRASVKHTVVGFGIHHLASIFWALLYELAAANRKASHLADVAKVAAGTSATAAFVDYCLTPQRLRPGFEKRLSTRSLLMVYAGFAAGLGAATLSRSLTGRR